jgi:hypothetical protein
MRSLQETPSPFIGPKSYGEFLRCRLKFFASPPPKFIIAGTGRNGSRAIAQTLTGAGIPCGHEAIYTAWGICHRRDLLGDSSWLAVPSLGSFSGLVVHAVRHPMLVVQSMLDIRFFQSASDSPYTRFARRFVPLGGHPVEDAFRWYFEWNSRIEKFADMRFRLEESEDLVAAVAGRLGLPIGGKVTNAAKEIDINRKESGKTRAYLADFAAVNDPQLRRGIERMAVRYGYDLQMNGTY